MTAPVLKWLALLPVVVLGKLAAQFGIPPLIIGLTVVAFGTSAPSSSITAISPLGMP